MTLIRLDVQPLYTGHFVQLLHFQVIALAWRSQQPVQHPSQFNPDFNLDINLDS